MQTLTNGQKQALLESQNGHNIFISGGGGVGKSYKLVAKTHRFACGMKATYFLLGFYIE